MLSLVVCVPVSVSRSGCRLEQPSAPGVAFCDREETCSSLLAVSFLEVSVFEYPVLEVQILLPQKFRFLKLEFFKFCVAKEAISEVLWYECVLCGL